jgi:5-methyltetrahydropteroyltriglutamate--homocysteine methyltransferase
VKRSTDRILTTHSGSLPRSSELLQLLAERDAGAPFDAATFERTAAAAVSDAVDRQLEAGLDVINDGEQSKASFQSYRYQRLAGFELVDAAGAGLPTRFLPAEARQFPEFYERWQRQWFPAGEESETRPAGATTLCCTGPVTWSDFSEVERDIANLQKATAGKQAAEVFMTAISPATYAPANLHYSSEVEYLDAMADAMAREYEAIVEAGFLLQIDAPDLTTMYRLLEIDLDEFLPKAELWVAAINRSVRNIPRDRVRVHVCWGADEAPRSRDVELADLVHVLLRLEPAGLSLAGANGRHAHEWNVWQKVPLPDGKVLVPGVVDSTTNIIEHPETVAQRIVQYAGVVGRENLVAGVDCGFGTVAGVVQVDERVAWAKLRSLAEGAALASRELF